MENKIKPQDLRIGNIVHLKDSDYCNYLKVDGISSFMVTGHFHGAQGDSLLSYDDIDGIPLTEEMMADLFNMHDNFFSPQGNYVEINKDMKDFGITAHRFPCHHIELHCQYLHQLQNLYFSVTNNELDISKVIKRL